MDALKTIENSFAYAHEASAPLDTGWGELDEHLGGGFRDGLYTLTGEPKCGKTALAVYLQLMAALSHCGAYSYYSLELPAEHITARMLSAISCEAEGLEPFSWAEYESLRRDLCDEGKRAGSPLVAAYKALKKALERNDASIEVEEPTRQPSGKLALVESGVWETCDEEYWNTEYLDHGRPKYCDVKGLPLHENDIESLLGSDPSGETGMSAADWYINSSLTVIDYMQLLGVAELGEDADVYRKTNKVVGYLAQACSPIIAISEQNRTALRSTAKDGGRYGASGSGRIEYAANAALRLALRKDEGDRGRIVELHVDLSRYGAPTGNNPILLRYLPQDNVFAPLDEG